MNKTIIIAEAGVNHNGDIRIAKQLVDAAAMAGADYVKFQKMPEKQTINNRICFRLTIPRNIRC